MQSASTLPSVTVNPYISYREAGETATETYLLPGAPNDA